MKLTIESGLWRTAADAAPGPLVAVLEVSGAVLSWTVDQPGAPEFTFTDPHRADWLWQVIGESGHVAIAAALAAPAQSTVDLPALTVSQEATDRLRRLALGHWLRRWWPASRRDGIAGLDPALLAAELAVLTAAAGDFFSDDTLDSDVADLLAPHAEALATQMLAGDPRIVALVRRAAELADDLGLDGWGDLLAALEDSPTDRWTGRRDDYALAAGADPGSRGQAVLAAGVSSVRWSAVPPGIFDAAEDTVDWAVEVVDARAVATVRVAAIAPPDGIAVRLRSGAISGSAALDADGRAMFALADSAPLTETAAWDHNWSGITVAVGVESAGAGESPEIRDRIRQFARQRLQRPTPDAYLAEIVAAESDY
ncbi:MAG: hypothetical protein ABWY93_04370 [Mycobacterium sp.]